MSAVVDDEGVFDAVNLVLAVDAERDALRTKVDELLDSELGFVANDLAVQHMLGPRSQQVLGVQSEHQEVDALIVDR